MTLKSDHDSNLDKQFIKEHKTRIKDTKYDFE